MNQLIRKYNESTIAKENMAVVESLQSSKESYGIESAGYATGYLYQLYVLFGRSMRGFTRAKLVNTIRLFQTLLFAIIIGLIYLRIGSDQTSITNRVGALFFIVSNQGELISIHVA